MLIGNLSEFNVRSGNWTRYVERMEMFFKVNSVTEELLLPTLIAAMGDEAYELLCNITSPEKPSAKTYAEVVKIMTDHLHPKPSFMAERYRFRQRTQNDAESILQYVSELEKMSKYCEFTSTSLEENLRDQLVCGLRSESIRKRLFTEENLQYENAIKIACALEAAVVQSVGENSNSGGSSDTATGELLAAQDSKNEPLLSGAEDSLVEDLHHLSLNSYKPNLSCKREELNVARSEQAGEEPLFNIWGAADGENIAEIVQGLRSGDLVKMTSCARAARDMTCGLNPPITHMVTAGVVKPLVDALSRYDCADVQLQAAWAITNITAGTHEHTMAVVDGGAIPKLVVLLARGGEVGEQSAWALSNIAVEGPHARDAVLAHGALDALLPLFTRSTPAPLLKHAVCTYSNICRNKNPLVKFDYVAPALPYISDLLEITDQDALADACWALSYLTDGPNERIEAVQMTPQLLPRLVSLLEHKSLAVRTPALRAIGNMLTGSDKQTNRCLDAGCLVRIITLLRCGEPSLVKEAAWAVSNILAGTHAQIQRVIDAGVLQHVVHVLAAEDIKCQKEAAWAITNLCLGGTPEQLDSLISAGFLEPYCQLLSAPDHRAISVVLDGLNNYLQAAVKNGQVDTFSRRLKEIGALDRIEALRVHENKRICKKVTHILDNYF